MTDTDRPIIVVIRTDSHSERQKNRPGEHISIGNLWIICSNPRLFHLGPVSPKLEWTLPYHGLFELPLEG